MKRPAWFNDNYTSLYYVLAITYHHIKNSFEIRMQTCKTHKLNSMMWINDILCLYRVELQAKIIIYINLYDMHSPHTREK